MSLRSCRIGRFLLALSCCAMGGASGASVARAADATCTPKPIASAFVEATEGAISAGVPQACFSLDGRANDAFEIGFRPSDESQAPTWAIRDGSGQQICGRGQGGDACTLVNRGPWQLIVEGEPDAAFDFSLSATRVTRATGCTPLSQAALGFDQPRLSGAVERRGGVRCFAFTSPGSDDLPLLIQRSASPGRCRRSGGSSMSTVVLSAKALMSPAVVTWPERRHSCCWSKMPQGRAPGPSV